MTLTSAPIGQDKKTNKPMTAELQDLEQDVAMWSEDGNWRSKIKATSGRRKKKQ